MKINLKQLQERKERKYIDQMIFMCVLGCAMALRENRVSQERTAKIIKDMQDNVNEVSKYLTSNTCIYAEGEKAKADVEANREILKRLSAEYGIKFKEEIFDM